MPVVGLASVGIGGGLGLHALFPAAQLGPLPRVGHAISVVANVFGHNPDGGPVALASGLLLAIFMVPVLVALNGGASSRTADESEDDCAPEPEVDEAAPQIYRPPTPKSFPRRAYSHSGGRPAVLSAPSVPQHDGLPPMAPPPWRQRGVGGKQAWAA